MIESKKASVYFVPHCVAPTDDDRLVIERCRKLMRHGVDAKLVPYMVSLSKLREFYNQTNIIMSARLHGIILSRPVPVIGIARGGSKTLGALKMLGIADYTVHATEVNLCELKGRINDLWDNAENIREQQVSVTKTLAKQVKEAVFSIRATLRREIGKCNPTN